MVNQTTMTIDDLFNHIDGYKNKHETFWALDLSKAYNTAFKNFTKCLANQAKSDKLSADIALAVFTLLVTIPIGGWMTASLGTAVVAQSAGTASTWAVANQVLQKNMKNKQIYNYVRKESFSMLTKKVKASAKQSFTNEVLKSPFSPNKSIDLSGNGDPFDFKINLEKFIGQHYDRIYEFARSVANDDTITSEEENAIATRIFNEDPFFAKAPTESTINDAMKPAEVFELVLLLGLVTRSDYQEYADVNYVMGKRDVTWKRGASIDAPVTDAGYGSNTSGGAVKVGAQMITQAGSTRVAYEYPGGDIIDRIEELWDTHIQDGCKVSPSNGEAERFGGNFLSENKSALPDSWFRSNRYGHDELVRAERALDYLAFKHSAFLM